MKTIDVVYSPICEANGAFLGQLEEWLKGTEVALMFQLQNYYSKFKRKYIEGIGVFEWNEGFMPYWVYDKYGFHKAEIIKDNMVVMEKMIN